MGCHDYLNQKSASKRIMLVFILFSLVLPSAALSETITIVADDWCPYNCEPGSDSPGYVVEVAREIFKNAGYRLEYKYVPWARALKEVTSGNYDGAIAATTKELPNGVFPEETLGYYANDLIIRNGDTWRFKNIDSLRQIKLGAIQDYNYGKELNTYIQQYKNSTSVQVIAGDNAVNRNIKKLLYNRIDVYLEDRNVALYTAKKMGLLDKIAIGGTEGKPIAMHIGFSPAKPESKTYARLLSEGIRKMRKSGQLAKILNKYGVSDWK
jgi:polar amino acid transport system substrate-binding protein